MNEENRAREQNLDEKKPLDKPLGSSDIPTASLQNEQINSKNWWPTIKIFIMLMIVGISGAIITLVIHDRTVVQPAIQEFYTVLDGERKFLHSRETIEKIMNGRKPAKEYDRKKALIEEYHWRGPFLLWPHKLFVVYEKYGSKSPSTGKMEYKPKMMHVAFELDERDIPNDTGIEQVIGGDNN